MGKPLRLITGSQSRSIRLLGPFTLLRSGQELDTTRWQQRPLSLLRVLAAHHGRVPRDQAIDLLWPDSSPEAGGTNLRGLVHRLRQLLGDDPAPVLIQGSWVLLNPTLDWEIDLVEFEEAVTEAGDVRRELARFTQRLKAELEVEPEEETLRLAEHLLRRPETTSDLRADGLEGSLRMLPPQQTPFIGREEELEGVLRLLAREGVRLVTLTGPGGSGKTRLAIEAAGRSADRFPDGVCFVNLAPVPSSDLAGAAMVEAMALPRSAQAPLDRLIARLRHAHFLLVLDNFEHVLEAATIVSDLLTACPDLQVMATSREILRLRAEYEYAVQPLALPPQGASVREPDLAMLERYDAIAFFLDRAGAARAGFSLTPDNAEAVTAICRRLDGIPLALELAAARIRLLPPDRLLERLDRRLAILTEGPRDLPHRQQTLRAAIDWSYRLLRTSEQTLLARLAVFVGGWTLEAAEVVCSLDVDLDVAVDLGSLVEKSLVRREQSGRFSMLETLREYAAERFQELPEGARIREEHARWVATLVGEDEPEPAARPAWYRSLDPELGNIRLALEWSREMARPDLGLRILVATAFYWLTRGLMAERRRWVDALVALDGGTDVRARILTLAFMGGTELSPGVERLEEALALARKIGDVALQTECLSSLSLDALALGDHDRAEVLARETLRLRQDVGTPRQIALDLNGLAMILLAQGEVAQARTLAERALAMARDLRDAHALTVFLSNLAIIALRCGDVALARDHIQEALGNAGPAGYDGAPAFLVEVAAGIAVAGGQIERGATLFGAAQTARIHLGWKPALEEQDVIDEATARGIEAIGEESWVRIVEAGRALTPHDSAALIRAFADGPPNGASASHTAPDPGFALQPA